MSLSWQANGLDLDTSNVAVVVQIGTQARRDSRRDQVVPLRGSTSRNHTLGRNLAAYDFTFRFIGPAQARAQRLAYLRNLFLSGDVILTAPDAPNEVYFNGTSKTTTVSLASHGTAFGDALGFTTWKVQAVAAS